MKKNALVKLVVIVSIGIVFSVFMYSCQKEIANQPEKQLDNYPDSESIVSHIITFKKRMELYRDNPNLKTELKYTAEEAAAELENLINYDFGYGRTQVDMVGTGYSELSMPLDELLEIGESYLSLFYFNQVIDSIQNQVINVNYSDSRLLFVGIEHIETTEREIAILGITSVVGNSGTIQQQSTETGWWFGFGYGDCDGVGSLDAVVLLEQQLNIDFNDPPPPGYVWRYKDIVVVGPLQPEDPDFINTDDDTEEDNYQDRLIFYANSEYNDPEVLTENDKCVSTDSEYGWNLEMGFYELSYFDIATDVMIENNGNNWYLNIDEFEGEIDYNDVVKHQLKVTSSYKYLSQGSMEDILDILEY